MAKGKGVGDTREKVWVTAGCRFVWHKSNIRRGDVSGNGVDNTYRYNIDNDNVPLKH